jgi:hypothetical protein
MIFLLVSKIDFFICESEERVMQAAREIRTTEEQLAGDNC